MPDPFPTPPAHPLRPTRRGLRWTSGLVLMAYVAAHLVNHALGLVSLETAEMAREAVHRAWRLPPFTLLLYGALAVHAALAFLALWERHTLRMPPLEALRLVLGFALPLLLALHIAYTRLAREMFEIDAPYARIVASLWSPDDAARQVALMTAAWLHGCIGVHLVFRGRPAWQRLRGVLLGAALLLPVLAALGFLSMGRELEWGRAAAAPVFPSAAQAAALDRAAGRIAWGHVLALAALLGAQAWRARREPRGGRIALAYPGRTLRVPRGWSVLEASRAHGVPHLSLCGGRARCSTCRVRVHGAPRHLPPPGPDEQRTLARVHAPPGVRLACQLRPLGDLEVTPLFAPRGGAAPAVTRSGEERDIAVLFVDLRRWSGLAQSHWPHDLVYVLDRYFALVGESVRDAGGVPNQFIGDSVMALFGLDTDLSTACRQAVDAARRIDAAMGRWNETFAPQFGHALEFGMGLHAGRAAVAEVGWRETTSFSAVGEVVNTASRLQDHTKAAAARLVVSRHAAQLAGLDASAGECARIDVRGRDQPLDVVYLRSLN